MKCTVETVETDENLIRYLRGDLPTQHMEQITQQLLDSEMMRYYLFGLEQTIYDLGMKLKDDLDTILEQLQRKTDERHHNLNKQIDELKKEYFQVYNDIDGLETKFIHDMEKEEKEGICSIEQDIAREGISNRRPSDYRTAKKSNNQLRNNSNQKNNQLKLFGNQPIQPKPNPISSKKNH
ncbi:MAG: hypothetical protein JNK77_17890 [Saprospiraceae bacterium]|nr:hypothetical protein [Saprospiraceae bacterium]